MAIPLEDYELYGRQLVLDGFGLPGQVKLQRAAVLVVGAGGLGCPALQYLGAAGIGRIGIVDHDRVELSNLQRQILHGRDTLGMHKADSAAKALQRLNPRLRIDALPVALAADNALSILQPYDIILDCTDNAPTRYLLSDACVVLGKPLVSGAAQKFEGQLCTYNLAPDGPCYRCLFPVPPPPESLGTCAETGILGVVTGVIGNMQALETIKLLTGLHDRKPTLLIFSALGSPPFRNVKLRSKSPACPACGTKSIQALQAVDYVQFCGGALPNWEENGLKPGSPAQRISVEDLDALLKTKNPIYILDVRPEVEFGICHLPNSTNIPLKKLMIKPSDYLPPTLQPSVFVVCRLGNDSQLAAEALRNATQDNTSVQDVIGGLNAWAKRVDKTFPIY